MFNKSDGSQDLVLLVLCGSNRKKKKVNVIRCWG